MNENAPLYLNFYKNFLPLPNPPPARALRALVFRIFSKTWLASLTSWELRILRIVHILIGNQFDKHKVAALFIFNID